MAPETDIAIVGGGPVGAALATALCGASGSALRVTVLEARAEPANDARPIALSHGSRLLLERLGAWDALANAPVRGAIDHIHVSQRGGFGRVAINAADAGVPHLGYVHDFNNIFAALRRAVRDTSCDYREGAQVTALARDGELRRLDYRCSGVAATLNARLVVIADGGELTGLAPPKVVDYGQHALTARVRTTLPHHNVAYERFTTDGPLALLPFGDEMALVWTLPPARAQVLIDAPEEDFLLALRDAFGGRLGEFKSVVQRACYPLTLRTATDTAGVVAIGNAAQSLHPVAGQGFNLGLRDAWELAQLLRILSPQQLHDSPALHQYRASRRLDRGAAIALTHGMVRLFSNDFFALNAARGVAMTALGCIPPLRDFAARRMIFGTRA